MISRLYIRSGSESVIPNRLLMGDCWKLVRSVNFGSLALDGVGVIVMRDNCTSVAEVIRNCLRCIIFVWV